MKKFVSVLLVLAMVFAVAACDASNSSKKSKKHKKDKKPKETVEEVVETDESEVIDETEETVEETEATETEVEETEETTTEEYIEIEPTIDISSIENISYVGVYQDDGFNSMNVYVTNYGLFVDIDFYRFMNDTRGVAYTGDDTCLHIDFDDYSFIFYDNSEDSYTLEVVSSEITLVSPGDAFVFDKMYTGGCTDDQLDDALEFYMANVVDVINEMGEADEQLYLLHDGYLDVACYYTIKLDNDEYAMFDISTFYFDDEGGFTPVHRFGVGDLNYDAPPGSSTRECLQEVGYPYSMYTLDEIIGAVG